MAEAHLDHPGEVSWYVGHGPAPVLGPCPHDDCRHLGLSVIAWGPDLERYELDVCGLPTDTEGCAGACRSWQPDHPLVITEPDGSLRNVGTFMHVDVAREHHTTREERERQVAR